MSSRGVPRPSPSSSGGPLYVPPSPPPPKKLLRYSSSTENLLSAANQPSVQSIGIPPPELFPAVIKQTKSDENLVNPEDNLKLDNTASGNEHTAPIRWNRWTDNLWESLTPGTSAERSRLLQLRVLPPLVCSIWILTPLASSKTDSNGVACAQDAQNFYIFLFVFYTVYVLNTIVFAWSLLRLILRLPSTPKATAISLFVALLMNAYVIILYSFTSIPILFVLVSGFFIGASPMMAYFYLRARNLEKRAAMLFSFSDAGADGGSRSPFSRQQVISTPRISEETKINAQQTKPASGAASLYKLQSLMMKVQQQMTQESIRAEEPTKYILMDELSRIQTLPHSSLVSPFSASAPQSLREEASSKPAPSNPSHPHAPENYTGRLANLVPVIFYLLVVFLGTAIFVFVYDLYSTNTGVSKNGYGTVFLSFFFQIFMTLAKIPMRLLAQRIDSLAPEGAVSNFVPICMYACDLFLFINYRALFLSVPNYQTFLLFTTISLVTEIMLYPIKLNESFFNFTQKISNLFKSEKMVLPNYPAFKEYQQKVIQDMFFRDVAQIVSLLAFSANYAFLSKAYNRHFFKFPKDLVNQATGELDSQAVHKVLYFFPISLAFEFLQAIAIRIITNRYAPDINAWKIGVSKLMHGPSFWCMFFLTIHVIQDAFITRNDLLFCN